MKKLRFLLLDANIIIKLHELRIWGQVLDRCDVLVAQTIVDHEAKYYRDATTDNLIDLAPDITAKRIGVVEVDTASMKAFLDRFDPVYFGEMDPGEAESLAYLISSNDPCLICSSDAIVFRVLGCLGLVEQGLSLETILQKAGLGRALTYQFTETFREYWTKRGQQDGLRGIGLKK
jgi:hypothetical protein